MTENNKQKLQISVLRQMITLATGGFGLVAALAWNNVIQDFVNTYIKKYFSVGGGILSLLIYAVLITALAVFVTVQLSTLLEKLESKQK